MPALGLKIPTVGPKTLDPGLQVMAAEAEAAGASSVWVSDHIVMTERTDSHYPYATSGQVTWDPDAPFADSLTACTWMAACSTRISVGPAVLILPLRDPIQLANTAATIDWLSGGRLLLGVGTGWYEEEFVALGREFQTRGRRTSEAIEVLKACWTGRPPEFEGEFFRIEPGTLCYPRPVAPGGIPVMVGGMGKLARERAARLGDGWLALTRWDILDVDDLARKLDHVHELRAPGMPALRTVLRVSGEMRLGDVPGRRGALGALAKLGFDEFSIDPPWDDLEEARSVIAECLGAIA
jgi:probable F420-dependent oxidoreductase